MYKAKSYTKYGSTYNKVSPSCFSQQSRQENKKRQEAEEKAKKMKEAKEKKDREKKEKTKRKNMLLDMTIGE